MKKLPGLSFLLVLCNLAQAQGTADSRLVATVTSHYEDSVYVTIDSTRLTYTGNNGWDYATNDWKYDSLRVWIPDPASSSWTEDKHSAQQIVNDRIVSRLSADYWGAGWQDKGKTDYTYANGVVVNKQISKMGNGTYVPDSRYVMTYDARGLQIDSLYQETWGNPYWTNRERTISSYDMAGRKDTSRYQKWVFSDSKWVDQDRNIFIYSNGLLSERIFQRADSNGWSNGGRTIYLYLNGRRIAEGYEGWDIGTNQWSMNGVTEYDFDSFGNVIEERYSMLLNRKYTPAFREIRTFDEFHRIVTREYQSWRFTEEVWSGGYLVQNYYEAYTNDVENVKTGSVLLNVFPVPANEQITISASFTAAQPVAIIVRDMSGRVVMQLAEQAGVQFRKTISVAELPAGAYMINITGTTEVASKMISVTH